MIEVGGIKLDASQCRRLVRAFNDAHVNRIDLERLKAVVGDIANTDKVEYIDHTWRGTDASGHAYNQRCRTLGIGHIDELVGVGRVDFIWQSIDTYAECWVLPDILNPPIEASK